MSAGPSVANATAAAKIQAKSLREDIHGVGIAQFMRIGYPTYASLTGLLWLTLEFIAVPVRPYRA